MEQVNPTEFRETSCKKKTQENDKCGKAWEVDTNHGANTFQSQKIGGGLELPWGPNSN